ncbi:MAG: hypothetical protein M1820_008110 [Bogoriella megaspora]|nr:MAG: hypothetical protein M1820_008110 [Bogoriella megaspora]
MAARVNGNRDRGNGVDILSPELLKKDVFYRLANGSLVRPGPDAFEDGPNPSPALLHRMKHDKSILALAVSQDYIFAGTEGGEILVYRIDTFERELVLPGHRSSVLGLCYSPDDELLFSSAGDRMVHVWNIRTFKRKYSVFSTYDIGDVFCVSYSSDLQTIYLGAQNTSIQWYDLKDKDQRPAPKAESHPFRRIDRFFDSTGPGGIRASNQTPAIEFTEVTPLAGKIAQGSQSLEIHEQHICQFAHYGYVYCMMLVRGLRPRASEEVLISGGGDGVIKIWGLDGDDGGRVHELCALENERDEGCSVLSIAIDGTILYSGLLDGQINVWDLETRQLVRSMKAHRDDVLTMTVGGGFLFSGGVFGFFNKFNRQHERVGRRKAHDGRILASAFSADLDRPLLVTGGNDNNIAAWDVRDCIASPSDIKKNSDDKIVETLRQLVSYQTVSSDPRHREDCRRGASYLRNLFNSVGAVTEMLTSDTAFNPVVFAKFRGNPATAAHRKKILFYGHYDVVAASNDMGTWKTNPFVMEGIDGNLYGRGTSDNKGPIVAALHAVGELNLEQALGSDILFLIEGEEECGSRGFQEIIRRNREKIGDVDWIILANSYWIDDTVPCLTYGLRGVIHATVQIESSQPDLHSGVDGSSRLDEPLKDLVMLLSMLTGSKTGNINIPHFEDPILPLTAEEDKLYEDIIKHISSSNSELSNRDNLAEDLKKKWREPSLTIHRFQTSGPENSTIIPRRAKASLSIRLVPNQEASQVASQLKSFLYSSFATLGSSNRPTVSIDHQGDPWLGIFNNKAFQTLEQAIIEVWNTPDDISKRRRSSGHGGTKGALAGNSLSPAGTSKTLRSPPNWKAPPTKPSPATSSTLASGSTSTSTDSFAVEDPVISTPSRFSSGTKPSIKPLYIREGGSIPAIRFLEKEFNAPAAQLPCGQASDSAHLDNEKIRLLNLYKSKDIFKRVFKELPMK